MMRNTGFVATQAAFLLCALLGLPAAHAQITIGGSFGVTGPRASIGIPEMNTLGILPKTIAGQSVKYIGLDDGNDPSTTVKNIRKLTQQDDIDVMIGPNSPPTCLATSRLAAETKTVQICIAPIPIRNRWMFTVPYAVSVLDQRVVEDMKARHVKTVAFIGFSDASGNNNLRLIKKLAPAAGIRVVTAQRYDPKDTSVTGQVLKIIALHPDAVFNAAAGVPAALPDLALAARGYHGKIYHNPAVLNPAFLRVGGKAVEGIILPAPPYIVYKDLPNSDPNKKMALEYNKLYDAKYGAGRVNYFGTLTYDASLWLKAAIPVALKNGKPGTVAFRTALRNALEDLKHVAGVDSVYNLSPSNHNGVDKTRLVMVHVVHGKFEPIPGSIAH